MFYKGLRGLQGSVVQCCSRPSSNCTPQLPCRPWLYSSPRALQSPPLRSFHGKCLKGRCCMPLPARWGEEESWMMVHMAQRAASVQPCCCLPLPQGPSFSLTSLVSLGALLHEEEERSPCTSQDSGSRDTNPPRPILVALSSSRKGKKPWLREGRSSQHSQFLPLSRCKFKLKLSLPSFLTSVLSL